jgi:hypothetical protein
MGGRRAGGGGEYVCVLCHAPSHQSCIHHAKQCQMCTSTAVNHTPCTPTQPFAIYHNQMHTVFASTPLAIHLTNAHKRPALLPTHSNSHFSHQATQTLSSHHASMHLASHQKKEKGGKRVGVLQMFACLPGCAVGQHLLCTMPPCATSCCACSYPHVHVPVMHGLVGCLSVPHMCLCVRALSDKCLRVCAAALCVVLSCVSCVAAAASRSAAGVQQEFSKSSAGVQQESCRSAAGVQQESCMASGLQQHLVTTGGPPCTA